MRNSPVYNSGVLTLYKSEQRTIDGTDAKKTVLVNQGMKIWYREISIYDRVRAALEQSGKEVTMKIRIPEYRAVDSTYYCLIDGKWHQVYNAAHIVDKDGFRSTELTLIAPADMHPEVEDDKNRTV